MTAPSRDYRGVIHLAHVILDRPGEEAALASHVTSLRVYLPGPEEGQAGVEVQVAVVDGSLVIIAAGDVLAMDRDSRGFARVRVSPE